jgi:acetylornithine deacetylase/succinyl-diaminopimelate desuccinylase-like protein
MKIIVKEFSVLFVLAVALGVNTRAQEPPPPRNPLAHDIFKQLIEINTTDSVGNVTTAAEAMAMRLREGGFAENEVIVAGPNERKENLVVRLRGSGKREPVLFIGHLDVVEARREDWSTDPFRFIEKDGFFYGRGTGDMKEGDAMLITNFIRLKQEHYLPDRDLIVALTADEEGGDFNGIDWLLKEHREWIAAEYCINLDAGEFDKKDERKSLCRFSVSIAKSRWAQFIAQPRQRHLPLGGIAHTAAEFRVSGEVG